MVSGLPRSESAYARKRLGDASSWDDRTELAALSVEYLQMIFKALGGQNEFARVPRPFETPEPEPAETIGLGGIMDFLKGI